MRSATRPIRVLHVIDSLSLGGAEQLLVTLARFHDRNRCNLRVCSVRLFDGQAPVPRALRQLRVPMYALGGRRRQAPIHVFKLAWMIQRHRIDIVHTHLPYANVVGVLAGRLARRPVLSTLHNIAEVNPPAGWNMHRVANVSLRWGPASMVVACAPEVGREAVNSLHLERDRVRIVANAVHIGAFSDVSRDESRVCRDELLNSAPGPLIVSIGNLLPGKGHDVLVDAIAQVRGDYPGVRVAIVGAPGPNHSLVVERIAALGLSSQVVLTGSRDDVPAILAAADVVVLPSLWEGLPLVLLEAMAAGKPVVATSVGGVPGVIQDGVTGRLVRPADPAALARAVLEVLARPSHAAALGSAAQASVRATYSADRWVERLQSVYSEVVSRNSGTGTSRRNRKLECGV